MIGTKLPSLRELARRGELRAAAEDGRDAWLRRAAYPLVFPIVFDRVTRRLERARGHRRCALGPTHLAEGCLDGYHDDVEAVLTYLLATSTPIADLEGWVAHWAGKATVDGHRRRRGTTGALQRPRMTRALSAGLGGDPWLEELALLILGWVGVPAAAGAGLWPLETWAQSRALTTGDHAGSTPARVASEVDRVLAVMRDRGDWYATHVEQPLGHKEPPLATPPGDGADDSRPLLPSTPADRHDTRFGELAGIAVEAIRAGLRGGHNPAGVIADVLACLFVDGTGADELDRAPATGAAPHQRVSALLGDPVALGVLVTEVLGIVGDVPPGQGLQGPPPLV